MTRTAVSLSAAFLGLLLVGCGSPKGTTGTNAPGAAKNVAAAAPRPEKTETVTFNITGMT